MATKFCFPFGPVFSCARPVTSKAVAVRKQTIMPQPAHTFDLGLCARLFVIVPQISLLSAHYRRVEIFVM